MKQAILLVAHGTVDDLAELPEFVTRIRRGHPPPPELLDELRHRYAAIGGKSPLNTINQRLAARIETATGVVTRFCNRLARPLIEDVVAELGREGVTHLASVPLAQYSASIYAQAVGGRGGESRPLVHVRQDVGARARPHRRCTPT